MLYHHDARDYKVASSEAATHARHRFDKLIETGLAKGSNIINHVMNVVPEDSVVKPRNLKFDLYSGLRVKAQITTNDDAFAAGNTHRSVTIGGVEYEISPESKPTLVVDTGSGLTSVHPHAQRQMAEKLGMSLSYMSALLRLGGEWREELLLHNFRVLSQHSHARNLVRVVGKAHTAHGLPEMRAFLSDRYKRLDSRPILEAFTKACSAVGAVPYEGTVTDTRMMLKAILPMVFEPVDNEPCAFGVQLMNSDFGAGKLSLRVFMLRLWCTNKAVGDEELGKMHLGTRLHQDIEFSQKTYALDTETNASAVKDIVTQCLAPDAVHAKLDILRQADAAKITNFSSITSLKKALSKGEYAAAKGAFEGKDEYNLPPGKSVWRLSNALSWIANSAEGFNRRQELEQLAGDILKKVAA